MSNQALDKFMELHVEITDMLRSLQDRAEDHWDCHPDRIHWGDVGDLQRVRDLVARAYGASCL